MYNFTFTITGFKTNTYIYRLFKSEAVTYDLQEKDADL